MWYNVKLVEFKRLKKHKEGLDVTLTYNDGSFQSLKNLIEGDTDIITVAGHIIWGEISREG